ncbi:helix-turn-helix domain-containing protein [Enterovibrio sp. FF113]|uniref:helix-turn-helix domain-containing protein n=1 Tax=Enterovibrio sp. FF113 TaxID=3230010 RepID=UPI00352ED45B
MLAIPVPFVVSLLLVIAAMLLYLKLGQSGMKSILFALLCAICTSVVGLRWTFDLQMLRFIQPILASILPVAAWYCFARAHHIQPPSRWHWCWPFVIAACSFNYQIWPQATDIVLIALYVGYGGALIRSSFTMPEEVRLSNVERVIMAERTAGAMLLFSAFIDSALSFDFVVYNGDHAAFIISLSYLVLIPMVVIAVAIVGFSTLQNHTETTSESTRILVSDADRQTPESPTQSKSQMSDQDATDIMNKLDVLMIEKASFRDPDITLSRLSRQLGIPAKQVSIAVNQIRGENISKVINAYRIEHAKVLLSTTEDSITDIYLASGFQTKSNFNREFLRLTSQTPSAFRALSESPS